MALLLVLGLALLGFSGWIVSQAMLRPAMERRASLARAAGRGPTAGDAAAPSLGRLLHPAAGVLAQIALRLTPRQTMDGVQSRLLAAGLARRISPTTYLAGKLVFAGCFTFLGFTIAGASGKPAAGFLFAIVVGGLGVFLPEFALSRRATARGEAIAAALPKAIDLLAVSVEAGHGFDAALSRLLQRLEGPLAEELEVMLSEIRIGESRESALRRLASRIDAPPVASFVHAVIRSEQLGTSLARVLRTQAEDQRHRRQIAAEERAMKAPVKMLFPTALFIFPAMFIVILGPAMMTLTKMFNGLQ